MVAITISPEENIAQQIIEEAREEKNRRGEGEFKDWEEFTTFILNDTVYGWSFLHPLVQDKIIELIKVAPELQRLSKLL